MVDAFADEAEDVLFGVGVRVSLDAIAHAPRQRGDGTADGRRLHARVEGGNVRGERAAPGVADAAEALGIDFRKRRQVVDGADAVPNAVAGQVGPEQVERIAEDRVLTADEVEERLVVLRVPDLVTFSLA